MMLALLLLSSGKEKVYLTAEIVSNTLRWESAVKKWKTLVGAVNEPS